MAIGETIAITGFRTRRIGVTGQRQIQPLAEAAHPADVPSRHTGHQGIRFHIAIDHAARRDESIFADGAATYNGAVRAQRRAAPDQSVLVLILANHP